MPSNDSQLNNINYTRNGVISTPIVSEELPSNASFSLFALGPPNDIPVHKYKTNNAISNEHMHIIIIANEHMDIIIMANDAIIITKCCFCMNVCTEVAISSGFVLFVCS